MGFSGCTYKGAGRGIDKACRGSEVPLRAFCREARLRFHASPSESRVRFMGVGSRSPDLPRSELNCDAVACVVKLICPSKQYV